jgi:hypothetical protein
VSFEASGQATPVVIPASSQSAGCTPVAYDSALAAYVATGGGGSGGSITLNTTGNLYGPATYSGGTLFIPQYTTYDSYFNYLAGNAGAHLVHVSVSGGGYSGSFNTLVNPTCAPNLTTANETTCIGYSNLSSYTGYPAGGALGSVALIENGQNIVIGDENLVLLDSNGTDSVENTNGDNLAIGQKAGTFVTTMNRSILLGNHTADQVTTSVTTSQLIGEFMAEGQLTIAGSFIAGTSAAQGNPASPSAYSVASSVIIGNQNDFQFKTTSNLTAVGEGILSLADGTPTNATDCTLYGAGAAQLLTSCSHMIIVGETGGGHGVGNNSINSVLVGDAIAGSSPQITNTVISGYQAALNQTNNIDRTTITGTQAARAWTGTTPIDAYGYYSFLNLTTGSGSAFGIGSCQNLTTGNGVCFGPYSGPDPSGTSGGVTGFVALGTSAFIGTGANNAIQIGNGENSTANSVQFNGLNLLNTSTGAVTAGSVTASGSGSFGFVTSTGSGSFGSVTSTGLGTFQSVAVISGTPWAHSILASIDLNNGTSDSAPLRFLYATNLNMSLNGSTSGIPSNCATSAGMRFVKNDGESGGSVLGALDTNGNLCGFAGANLTTSFTLAGGTTMTGNVGTGTKIFHASGTATSGNLVIFDSTLSAADSGIVPSSIAFLGAANTFTATQSFSNQTIYNPAGTAISGTNYQSQQNCFDASIYNGTSASPDTYCFADQPLTNATNSPTHLVINHSGPGAGSVYSTGGFTDGTCTMAGGTLSGCSTISITGGIGAQNIVASGAMQGSEIYTTTSCASSASPAVCAAAASGSVVVAASSTSVVVDTTAVTNASQIQITFDASLGARLGVTCNTTAAQPTVLARTAGVSFTISTVAPITNPACFSYTIFN